MAYINYAISNLEVYGWKWYKFIYLLLFLFTSLAQCSLSLSLSLSHGLTLSSHCQSCPRQLLPSLRRSHQPLSISPWGHASPNFADLAHNIITLSTLLVFWSCCFRSPTFRPSPPLDLLPSVLPHLRTSHLRPNVIVGFFFFFSCGLLFDWLWWADSGGFQWLRADLWR